MWAKAYVLRPIFTHIRKYTYVLRLCKTYVTYGHTVLPIPTHDTVRSKQPCPLALQHRALHRSMACKACCHCSSCCLPCANLPATWWMDCRQHVVDCIQSTKATCMQPCTCHLASQHTNIHTRQRNQRAVNSSVAYLAWILHSQQRP
jgi:hypothetical protein